MVILISVLSLITTIIGLYYLGEKNKNGFIIFTFSLTCQLYLFYVISNWFLVFQMIVLMIFNMRNYFKWRNENENFRRN